MKSRAPGFLAAFIGSAPDALALERGKEALGHGVIMAIASSAHRVLKIVSPDEGSPVHAGELRALIGVDPHPVLRLAPPYRHVQRLQDHIGGLPALHRPTHHAAQVEVDHDSQIVRLTDVRTPGTSGIELVQVLNAGGGGTVPVIVITGHADVPLATQAIKAGVADFIEKPFDDEIMLSAIRRALAQQAGNETARAERQSILDRMAGLSARERGVVDGLVAVKANKAIAFDLSISARTVEVYRANAMMKMQAKTLSDLVRMATIAQLDALQ